MGRSKDKPALEWRPIDDSTPNGEHILFFPRIEPATGRSLSHPAMMRIDYYPVSYPRQPTHWMPKPKEPV